MLNLEIDHIGIAVNDLDEAVKTYLNLCDAHYFSLEEVLDQQVKVAFIQIGNQKIELLEPLEGAGPIQRFLDKRGQGMHHMAFRVADIKEAIVAMQQKGFRMIDEKPRIGAGDKWIAFMHPQQANGVLIELCQPRDETP